MIFKLITYLTCAIGSILLFFGTVLGSYLIMFAALFGIIDLLSEVFKERRYSRILSLAVIFILVSSFLSNAGVPYFTSFIISIMFECTIVGVFRIPLLINHFKKVL